jgi:polyhydroxyalkanoate synthesis regulator phasin
MARQQSHNLFERLRKLSEEGAASFFNEVISNDEMRRRLGRAGERFLANKRLFDRNVEALLDFINLPSKKDVVELKSRLDELSGELLNLNLKVDRALAGTAQPKAAPANKQPNAKRPRR